MSRVWPGVGHALGLAAQWSVLPVYLGLVVQNRVQKRAMNLDLSIVADEAELAELIHEEANP